MESKVEGRRSKTAAWLALAMLGAASPALHADEADLVLRNGRLYTLEPARPWAEALAVRGDRILAVGSFAEVSPLIGARTQVIDLRGAFALPGFNDGHVHVEATGALLVGVNLLDVHEPTAFRQRIAEAARRLPRGSWITRGDWGAYEQWSEGSSGAPEVNSGAPLSTRSLRDRESGKPGSSAAAAPFLPDRRLIDEVTPDHPVLVSRFDGSVHLANSLALKQAGVSETTLAPAGGVLERDASGRLTGILRGSALDLVRKAVGEPSLELRLLQVKAVLDEARQSGVTTMQDLTTAPQLRAYQELERRGELTARLSLRPTLDRAAEVSALGLTRGFGSDRLRFVGYKAWVDGIMGNSTALFFEPYAHDPGNVGRLRPIMLPEGKEGAALALSRPGRYTDAPPGNLERLLQQAAATGLPPHVHAIGDKAVTMLLDVYERVLTEEGLLGRDHRWRVIHAQVVDPADLPRFGRLGLVAEVNPYHVSDDMRWMEERIGHERARGAYAFRSLKQAGAVLVFGSDSPGTNAARYYLNPMYGLYAAVTRQTLKGEPAAGWFPDQRLTIEEALEAATKAPAWAAFEEGLKGTLAPGKLADVAVFDRDLVETGGREPRQLLDARVLWTIMGGRIVYEGAR